MADNRSPSRMCVARVMVIKPIVLALIVPIRKWPLGWLYKDSRYNQHQHTTAHHYLPTQNEPLNTTISILVASSRDDSALA
jgi:hypothetical protein